MLIKKPNKKFLAEEALLKLLFNMYMLSNRWNFVGRVYGISYYLNEWIFIITRKIHWQFYRIGRGRRIFRGLFCGRRPFH